MGRVSGGSAPEGSLAVKRLLVMAAILAVASCSSDPGAAGTSVTDAPGTSTATEPGAGVTTETSTSVTPPTAGTAPSTGPIEDPVITITEFSYPTDVVVPAGGTVTWVNATAAAHSVVFDAVDGVESDEPVVELPPGTEAAVSLAPGAWAYHCGIHERMAGTLLVGL